MSLKKTSVAALVAVSGAVVSSASFAQARGGAGDAGFYVGGSIGQSKIDCGDVSPFSCDDKDTAWKIFGGYKLNRNLGVELGYSNLGESTVSGFGLNATAEATAWDLVAVGSFPVANNFAIFGKLGLYNGEVELSSNVPGGNGKKTTTDLTFGFGVQYDFTRNLGVRGEWQRYSDAKTPATSITDEDKSDIDVLSIGIVYKF